MSAHKCCIAPMPDAGTWSIVHWRGSVRERFIVSAAQMRAEGHRTELRVPLCGGHGGDDPNEVVEDPRAVTCEKCIELLSGKYVGWHNRLLSESRKATT